MFGIKLQFFIQNSIKNDKEIWTKWLLWPKNVITQLFQRPYNLISILVVWKITDGERGVNEIQQWLINIQARAPNSPVIIVGKFF